MKGIQFEAELDDFGNRFTECAVSKDEWTHEAHLAVGLWHIERFGIEETLQRLRVGIQRLNDSHGTINSATSGYHETITRVYVRLLSSFSDTYADETLVERLTRLLGSGLSDRHALFAFYSRDKLMSAEARLGWVEPDVAPISLETIMDDGEKS